MLHRPACRPPSCVRHGHAAHLLTRDDHLLYLLGTVADLKAHDIAQSLLMRKVCAVASMTMRQQAAVNRLESGLGRPPFAHRRLGRVRQAIVPEPERLVTEQSGGFEKGLGFGER